MQDGGGPSRTGTRHMEENVSGRRLLYVVGQLRSGGLERQLYYLLKTMDRRRYNPAVFVWTYNEADRYVAPLRALGVPVWSFTRPLSAHRKLGEFRRIVKEVAPAVVHSYSFYTNFAAHWGTYGTDVLAVGSIRSSFHADKLESGPYLGRLSARWPATQICNSRQAADAARASRSPFVPRSLHVVRNGIDLLHFQTGQAAVTDQPVLIGVGSLVGIKRWDRLISTAATLKQDHYRFRVRIVGDGPQMNHLRQFAGSLGLAGTVAFPGQLDDIPSELNRASLLVHTSEIEGCPNVVMEAMASGRPVVAMDSGDIGALVEHGRTGFVVSQGREQDLALYIGRILSDPQLRRRMGEAGRDKAVREFGLDRLLAETLSAYRAAGWKDE